jgi:hypothetical protein
MLTEMRSSSWRPQAWGGRQWRGILLSLPQPSRKTWARPGHSQPPGWPSLDSSHSLVDCRRWAAARPGWSEGCWKNEQPEPASLTRPPQAAGLATSARGRKFLFPLTRREMQQEFWKAGETYSCHARQCCSELSTDQTQRDYGQGTERVTPPATSQCCPGLAELVTTQWRHWKSEHSVVLAHTELATT